MADIGTLIDFTDGNVLYAAQLDSNFGDIRTVVNSAVVHTDKASQTITKTITFTPDAGEGFIVSTGGATITAGGLTITAGGATVTAGNVAVTAGNLTFGAASAKVIPGATSLLFRDNADSATNLTITDAGAVTVRAGLTVGTGLTVSSGSTSLGATTVTSLSMGSGPLLKHSGSSLLVRNNSDTTTIISVSNASGIVLTAQSGTTQTMDTDVKWSATAGNFYLGGSAGDLATSAVYGFPILPLCAGNPSGAAPNGSAILDNINNRVYFRVGGAWKYAALV